jgi:hypothetical protein
LQFSISGRAWISSSPQPTNNQPTHNTQ